MAKLGVRAMRENLLLTAYLLVTKKQLATRGVVGREGLAGAAPSRSAALSGIAGAGGVFQVRLVRAVSSSWRCRDPVRRP